MEQFYIINLPSVMLVAFSSMSFLFLYIFIFIIPPFTLSFLSRFFYFFLEMSNSRIAFNDLEIELCKKKKYRRIGSLMHIVKNSSGR